MIGSMKQLNKVTMKNKRKSIAILISIITVIAVLAGGSAVYLCDYYRSDYEAIGAFLPQHSSWNEEPDNTVVFKPEKTVAGFIFYPGGKVEHRSYIPLMQELCERGVLCIIPEMPFNLAVFDINAADSIMTEYPEIESWYIGGHSLGGSMAASYLGAHSDEFDGLILLGSYSTEDLSDSDLDVLSVFGSEDRVMNKESYDENKANLPSDFTEIIIDGGCHAYFGMYGPQDGDGIPSISNEEQIRLTAEYISELISR